MGIDAKFNGKYWRMMEGKGHQIQMASYVRDYCTKQGYTAIVLDEGICGHFTFANIHIGTEIEQ
jgi:putative hemolysin